MAETKLTPEELAINRSGHVTSAIIPMVILALVAVGLRLLSRRIKRTPLWWDDYMIIVAMVLNLADLAISLLGVHAGLGKHAASLPPENIVFYVKTIYAFEMIYTLTIMTIKLSILFFYHRIFVNPRFQLIVKCLFAFVCLWGFLMVLIVIAQCIPVEHFWHPKTPGRCVNLDGFFIGSAVPNIVTDFIIVFLPMPLVWRLQLKREQKIALTGVFALAGFTCIASVIRISVLGREGFTDPTWTNVVPKIWTVFETCCGIISACLPTMRPIIYLLAGKSIATSRAMASSDYSDKPGSGKKSGASGSSGPRQTGWPGQEPESASSQQHELKGGSSAYVCTTVSAASAEEIQTEMDVEAEVKHFGASSITREVEG